MEARLVGCRGGMDSLFLRFYKVGPFDVKSFKGNNMLKYTYKYILNYVFVLLILSVGAYLFLPGLEIWSFLFFLVPILGIVLRYVNFIEVKDDHVVVSSLYRKRKFYYKDIEKIIIDKDVALCKGTIVISVYYKGKVFTEPFGNLKYTQAEMLKGLLGSKSRVILAWH